jgi:hypothetical protein
MTAPLLVATRELSAAELRRLREDRAAGRVRGATAPSRPTAVSDPLPEFRPQKPEAVFRQMMDHLQKWARSSKAEWMTALELFRKENPTMVAHMTDEQLMLMLKGKIEQSIKEAYGRMGRGRELQIKTGGF